MILDEGRQLSRSPCGLAGPYRGLGTDEQDGAALRVQPRPCVGEHDRLASPQRRGLNRQPPRGRGVALRETGAGGAGQAVELDAVDPHGSATGVEPVAIVLAHRDDPARALAEQVAQA